MLCSSDDLQQYSTLDLISRLVGEDVVGVWKERSVSSEISGFNDSTFGVANIYKLYGVSEYDFKYTVFLLNPNFDGSYTVIMVIVEEFLGLTSGT